MKCRVVSQHCRRRKSPGKRPCEKEGSPGTLVKTHTVPKGCASPAVKRIQAAARGKTARVSKAKKLSSARKLQAASRGKKARTSKAKKLSSARTIQSAARKQMTTKLRLTPNPPKTAMPSLSASDLKLLTTYNRKDGSWKIMNPPTGTAKIVKKVIPELVSAYDAHVLSDAARRQLVFLRIGPTQKLSMDNEFPAKEEFARLLSTLPEQYDSGGSSRAHFIVYNLTGPPSRQLKRREVVESPLWEKFQDEMGDPPHWFLYVMTLVVLRRYDYLKKVYLSSFTDDDVEELKRKYAKDLERAQSRLAYWNSRTDIENAPYEKERKDILKEIEALRHNMEHAKRITQK